LRLWSPAHGVIGVRQTQRNPIHRWLKPLELGPPTTAHLWRSCVGSQRRRRGLGRGHDRRADLAQRRRGVGNRGRCRLSGARRKCCKQWRENLCCPCRSGHTSSLVFSMGLPSVVITDSRSVKMEGDGTHWAVSFMRSPGSAIRIHVSQVSLLFGQWCSLTV
jgi:hypothetical protein